MGLILETMKADRDQEFVRYENRDDGGRIQQRAALQYRVISSRKFSYKPAASFKE